jgi:hypothetical protein
MHVWSNVFRRSDGDYLFAFTDTDAVLDSAFPMYLLTSRRDPGLFPRRAGVSVELAADDSALVAHFDSDHPEGISGYRVAIGTSPGQDDVSSWQLIKGEDTFSFNLAPLNLHVDQEYYVNAQALGANGHLSPVGSKFMAFDSDHDGIEDFVEIDYGLDPTDASDAGQDNDGDGLNNAEEIESGTDLGDLDTDEDGIDDQMDLFPLDATESGDVDRDGIGNNADIDDDNDGALDVDEIASGRNPRVNEAAILDIINNGLLDGP